VPICPDTRAEGTESFGFALQNPVNATLASPATATASLTDNEVGGTLRWSVADASGIEGTTLVLTVTRTGGTASDVTVLVETHDGDANTPGADAVAPDDYEALPPTLLTLDAGILTQTVEIPLLSRDGTQGPRAFRVTLHDVAGGAALGSPSTVTVWILDPS
jgi:Calx-beta domain